MFEKNQNHAKGKSTRAALTKAVCVRKCMIYITYIIHTVWQIGYDYQKHCIHVS